jgi:hypothetical protein
MASKTRKRGTGLVERPETVTACSIRRSRRLGSCVPRSHSCERLPENHKPDAMRENKLLGTEARGIRYVLVLLFIKCVSDKYAGMVYAPITIPPGAGFKDMVALKGQPDIGDRIKKKIVAPTTYPTCPTSTTPPSSAAARKWWTGPRSTSAKTAPPESPAPPARHLAILDACDKLRQPQSLHLSATCPIPPAPGPPVPCYPRTKCATDCRST